MNKTRKKIILVAIELFNEHGISNVRNQDIADKAGILLSNFNYYFGAKKDLVLAVLAYMGEILKKEVYDKHSSFSQSGQGYGMATSYFEFERKFCFFYLETNYLLTTYPEIKDSLKKQVETALEIIRNINYISVGKGYLNPTPPDLPELYEELARQVWINNHFFIAQMNIRDVAGDFVKQGMKSIFYLYYPYLTELGKAQFERYLKGE